MRFYETMFILKPTLTQEETSAKIEFFKNILLNNNASIEGTLDMGIRNLAYEIKKCKRGYYYVIYFKAPPSLIAELERNYRINEDIIRFIVINYKSKTEQKNWGVLVDKANGRYVEPPRKKKSVEVSENSEQTSDSSESDSSDFSDSSGGDSLSSDSKASADSSDSSGDSSESEDSNEKGKSNV